MDCHGWGSIVINSDSRKDIWATQNDDEFMANARTDIPALIQALESAWAERDRYREALEYLIDGSLSCEGYKCPGPEKCKDPICVAIKALQPKKEQER